MLNDAQVNQYLACDPELSVSDNKYLLAALAGVEEEFRLTLGMFRAQCEVPP